MNEVSSIKHPKATTFTIDGRPFTTQDDRQPAADLLRLAGLDPAGYDLAEVRPGGGKPRQYRDDQQVHIRDDAKFVSVRQRAEVA
jgi:hypothetical protein